MTWPGIETQFPKPLVNTLSIMPMDPFNSLIFNLFKFHNLFLIWLFFYLKENFFGWQMLAGIIKKKEKKKFYMTSSILSFSESATQSPSQWCDCCRRFTPDTHCQIHLWSFWHDLSFWRKGKKTLCYLLLPFYLFFLSNLWKYFIVTRKFTQMLEELFP